MNSVWKRFVGYHQIIKVPKNNKPFSIEFQKKDISTIHSTDATLAFADKKFNLCKLKKEQYSEILNEVITTVYKKASVNIHKKINMDENKLMEDKDTLNGK